MPPLSGAAVSSKPGALRDPEPPLLTITVISCLEGSRGLQVAAQSPIATVAVVEAAVDIHRVLGVGGGWQ